LCEYLTFPAKAVFDSKSLMVPFQLNVGQLSQSPTDLAYPIKNRHSLDRTTSGEASMAG
jgi:hypothetical protein